MRLQVFLQSLISSIKRKERDNMSKGKFALGALLGAAVGAASGLLFAPKSGKETREDIKKHAQDAYKDIEKTGKDVAQNTEDAVDNVKKQAEDFRGRAERAIDGAKKGFNSKN